MRQELAVLATSLADAWQNGRTIALPELGRGPADRNEAFAVQDRMAEIIAGNLVGWKVGASVEAVQFFEGHDGPIPGRLFEDRVFHGSGKISGDLCHTTKIESEIAFRLDDALPSKDSVTADDLRDRLTFMPAIEMSASRWAPGTGGRGIATRDGIADNGTAGVAVLGDPVENWREISFDDLSICSTIDDSPEIQVYSNAYRKDPVEIMADTVNGLLARDIRLQPGMVVLTGSLTLPTPIRQGQKLTVKFGDLDAISLEIE